MSPSPAPRSSGRLIDRIEAAVTISGDLLKFSCCFTEPPVVLNRKRGHCMGFTAGSRRRMLQFVSTLDFPNIKCGIFITLTYPDSVKFPSKEERNKHRYLFFRHMEKHLGRKVGALWRIEWEERKSGVNRGMFYPHFHLLIPCVQYIHWGTVRAWWRNVIGAKGPLVTDVRRWGDKRHCAVYVAKYCAKRPSFLSLDSVTYLNIDGRHWGIQRPTLIPRCKSSVYDGLREDQVEALQALGKETFGWYGEYAELGWTMFGRLGEKMIERVRQICLDDGDTPRYKDAT